MVDGRWWSSSTSPRGSSDWRGVPQRAPVRPTSRLRSRPKTETPTSSDLVAGLIGGEVDTSVTPNAPHRSSLPHFPSSSPPAPYFSFQFVRIRLPKSERERGLSRLLCRRRVLLSLSPHPRFIRSETGLFFFFFFFSPHLPCSLPSRGFGFRSSENAITPFTKCCTTDSSTTSVLPPDRFSAVCSSTNAVPSSSSLMSLMDGGSNTRNSSIRAIIENDHDPRSHDSL